MARNSGMETDIMRMEESSAKIPGKNGQKKQLNTPNKPRRICCG